MKEVFKYHEKEWYDKIKKSEKAFVGREQKFIYVPKVPKPRSSDVSKINKTFGTVNGNLHTRTSSGLPKVPIVASCFVEEVIDLDAPSSFGNAWFIIYCA